MREIFEGRKERKKGREERVVEKFHGYGGFTHGWMKIKRSEALFVTKVKLHLGRRSWILQAPVWCCMCWSLRYYCWILRHHLDIKIVENWLYNWWTWRHQGMLINLLCFDSYVHVSISSISLLFWNFFGMFRFRFGGMKRPLLIIDLFFFVKLIDCYHIELLYSLVDSMFLILIDWDHFLCYLRKLFDMLMIIDLKSILKLWFCFFFFLIFTLIYHLVPFYLGHFHMPTLILCYA